MFFLGNGLGIGWNHVLLWKQGNSVRIAHEFWGHLTLELDQFSATVLAVWSSTCCAFIWNEEGLSLAVANTVGCRSEDQSALGVCVCFAVR